MKSTALHLILVTMVIGLSACNHPSESLLLQNPAIAINDTLQQVVAEEVLAQQVVNNADWACAVMIDNNGQVVAAFNTVSAECHVSREIPLGSLFMPFSILMASRTGCVDSTTTVEVHEKGWQLSENLCVRDIPAMDTVLHVRDIIALSNNEGLYQLMMPTIWYNEKEGMEAFLKYASELGVDQFQSQIVETKPVVTQVSASPLHVAWLYHCLANGFFSAEWKVTGSGVMEGLHDCVWKNSFGTASKNAWGVRKAQSDIIAIMGKTGTAIIDEASSQYMISFVGIFPEVNPQYTCLVVFSRPQSIYDAGTDCGSTVRRIAERIYNK